MNEFVETYLRIVAIQGRENPLANRQYQTQQKQDMTLYLCPKCGRIWETYAISGDFCLVYLDSKIFN